MTFKLSIPQSKIWNAYQHYRFLCVCAGRRGGKCVDFNSIVPTADGLLYMYEILGKTRDEIIELEPDKWYEINTQISTETSTSTASGFYIKGISDTKRITTHCGYEISGTDEHRIKILGVDGVIKWKYFKDIVEGDYACVNRKSSIFPSNEVITSEIGTRLDFYSNNYPARFKDFPSTFDADWGYFMGLLVANGSWGNKTSVVTAMHLNDSGSYIQAYRACGITQLRQWSHDRTEFNCSIHFNDAQLRRFLHEIGWIYDCTVSTKSTPWIVRKSPKHVVAAYLSGLFDGDGCAESDGKCITFSTASNQLAIETQLLLLQFGIVCFRGSKIVNDVEYYSLRIRGRRAKILFANNIGFRLKRKQDKLISNIESKNKEGGDTEAMPYQKKWLQEAREFLPMGNRWNGNTDRTDFRKIVGNSIKTNNTEEFSSCRLNELVNFVKSNIGKSESLDHFANLQNCDYFYDKIEIITTEKSFCVDLSVPEYKEYVCQGFTSHNSEAARVLIGLAASKPEQIIWYVAPTYRMAKRLMWRKLKKSFDKRLIVTKNESELSIELVNGSLIQLFGADNPDGLVGESINACFIDEAGLMTNLEQVVERSIRPALADKQGSLVLVTTPRGFNYFYSLCSRCWNFPYPRTERVEGNDKWWFYSFTTTEGGNVTADELTDMAATMPKKLYDQEVNAQFTTPANRVYDNYDFAANELDDDELRIALQHRQLLIGIDFNVNPMNAVIAVATKDECHVIDSIEVMSSNTDELCQEIKYRYPGYSYLAFPDPSGKARKTSAPVGITDFVILERNGFTVYAPNKAPMIVDRVNAVQAMLCSADGKRRLLVHKHAKTLVRALNGQCYKEGTSIPEKGGVPDLSGASDSLGYLIFSRFNLFQQKAKNSDERAY